MEQQYKTVVLRHDLTSGQVEESLNQTAAEGWRFVTGWSVLDAAAMRLSEYVTTLVFEREQTAINEFIPFAVDVERIPPNGDDILRREMASAQDDARPVDDPLLAGLVR